MAISVGREELASLHDDWTALLARAVDPAPFLHPTWHRVWLDEFQGDRELVLLAAREAGELLGVASLLREDGKLSFVGHYSICDYMDFVLTPERPRDVLDATLSALEKEAWSELELRGLREDSPALAAMPSLIEARGLAFEREEEAIAPRIELAASWDEHLASLSKKDRHELRRKMRRVHAAGNLEVDVYTSPEAVEEHLPVLLRQMVESRADKANFLSEQMGRFFHRMAPAMAAEGLVRLYGLTLDTKQVASVLCFDQGGHLFLYNSGYDPELSGLAVGIVSKAVCLQDAIESGHRYFDFLRGHEPYKYDLGGKDQQVYRCVVRKG